MFPPQKNSGSKPQPKPSPGGRSGPASGPPPPFPPPPPGSDPFGAVPAGGPAMPPGMDPFGGAAMPPLGGGTRPGQGMDPMAAMLGGLGAGAPPPQGPPMGPNGLPVGGEMPGPDADPEMGGSPLLQAMMGALQGGGDPYTQPPGGPDHVFDGMGQGDPHMGLDQLLSMLALGQMGVGGGPSPGSLAAGIGPQSVPGQMVGMGY